MNLFETPPTPRRAARGALAVTALALTLSACMGGGGGTTTTAAIPSAQPVNPAGPATPGAGNMIGAGSVRVGLLLPMTAPGQGAATAASLRNAAELAIQEFQGPDLTLLVKDDRGTPEGAQAAAQEAVDEGAELLIGPLFAPSVQAAGSVARQTGRPLIAFSTDASVAARGVYLLSFLAQAEVDRIVDHAAAQGRRSFAALVPETTYGSVVEAQFREATARRGLRVVQIERYPAGQPAPAVQRLQPVLAGGQADALFIPENGDGIGAVGQALAEAKFDPQRVKPVGTGVWNDPRVQRVPQLQGGWFAAPDTAGYTAFSERYRVRYGADPSRLATLSYDAVSLAAALARTQGSQRFSEGVLTNASGFKGADGVFRFKPDGTNERALAVQEIRGGATATVSPAPKALPGA